MKAMVQGIPVDLYPAAASCTARFHGHALCRGVEITSISVNGRNPNDAVNHTRELIIKARKNGTTASGPNGYVTARQL